MKWIVFSLFAFCSSLALAKYITPFVSVSRGKVEYYNSRGEVFEKVLFKTLLENIEIKTTGDSQARIELEKDAYLVVLPNSVVVLQVGAWEKLDYRGIQIKQGSVRLAREGSEGVGMRRYLVASPVTELSFLFGDMIFNYDSAQILSEVISLHGQLDFSGMGRDEMEQVVSQSRVAFKGEKEDGEPSYDLLLHGKKVARGKIIPLQKLGKKDLEIFQKVTSIPKPKNMHLIGKPKKKPGEICESPFGKLNDCSWVCESGSVKIKKCFSSPQAKCVRRRCDANGRWSDPTPVGLSLCEDKVKVMKCDY